MLIELDFGISVLKLALNGIKVLTKPILWKEEINTAMHSVICMNSSFVPMVMKSVDRKQVIPSPFHNVQNLLIRD